MRKLTINDFSGGVQESTVSDDFSPRQWAQMRGIIPSSELNFESQWPIQTVGVDFTGVRAVFPLPSSLGTFLVAIKTDGTLWWAQAPAADAAFADANLVVWSEIETAENLGWADGDTEEQPAIPVLPNEDYKFICPMPVEVYKYVRLPKTGDADNVSADMDDPASPRGVLSGVLIHSTTVDGEVDDETQQALVAYVDTSDAGSVKVIVFPHIRRFPTHGDEGDFINAKVINSSGAEEVVGINDGWPLTYTPSVRHHPYTYLNKDAALLPGTGVIPRANVGCMKGGVLLLGDIEWRSTFNTTASALDSLTLEGESGKATFGTTDDVAVWPNGVDVTARVLYNQGSGIVYLHDSSGLSRQITNKQLVSDVVTLTTSGTHSYAIGDKVEVVNVGAVFNGLYTITGVTPNTFSYAKVGTDVAFSPVTATNARSFAYTYRMEVGQYQPVPNSWTDIYLAASVNSTVVKVVRQLNLATHILNDETTGPYRGGLYFSAGEIDAFDPRAVLVPGKTDVAVRGVHVLDDTVIVVTTAGSDLDGVYRIRGYFSDLINYSGESNPTAVRLELVRGGVGAAKRSTTVHKNFSCLWSEAGIVVFVDRLGGVWFTDGQTCDRFDRFGPRSPARATEDDHVAALGKHLFLWRDGRMLVFTIMESAGGQGSGCWTEVNMPGAVSSMVGAQEDLYLVRTVDDVSQVCRLAPAGPAAERACVDGEELLITVSTATVGSVSDHNRTTWHRFGMTFTTPTECVVHDVRIQSTGALNVGDGVDDNAVFPDVQYRVTLDRTFADVGVLGEFTVPAGIGPQAEASATVSFTGFVQLQSASFWVTGQDPRSGDK